MPLDFASPDAYHYGVRTSRTILNAPRASLRFVLTDKSRPRGLWAGIIPGLFLSPVALAQTVRALHVRGAEVAGSNPARDNPPYSTVTSHTGNGWQSSYRPLRMSSSLTAVKLRAEGNIQVNARS